MKLVRIILCSMAIAQTFAGNAHAQIGGRGSFLRDEVAESSPNLKWITQYGQAIAESKRTGKPILLSFRCVP